MPSGRSCGKEGSHVGSCHMSAASLAHGLECDFEQGVYTAIEVRRSSIAELEIVCDMRYASLRRL